MALVTSQGYQLVPDALGAIQSGQKIAQNRQVLESNQLKADQLKQSLGQQKEYKDLQSQMFSKPEYSVQSITNPELANNESVLIKSVEIDTPQQKDEFSDFADKIESAPADQVTSIIQERTQSVSDRGGNAEHTAKLTGLPPEQVKKNVKAMKTLLNRDTIRKMYAMDPTRTQNVLSGLNQLGEPMTGGLGRQTPAQQKSQLFEQFSNMPEGPEKQQFGTLIGAISKTPTVQQKIDIQKGVGDVKSEQDIRTAEGKETKKLEVQTKLAPNLEKQKALSKDAAGLSTAMFKQMGGVEKNIANLEEGIRLIDEGANVGPVDKWLPSFKAASVEMENLKSRLGMDVIGSVTFGALSKGELDLAMDTAIPPNLGPDQLKAWFQDRIEPQRKLLLALEDASIFLAEDGATIPKLMAKRRQERQQSEQEPAANQQPTITATGADGTKLWLINGQWVKINE